MYDSLSALQSVFALISICSTQCISPPSIMVGFSPRLWLWPFRKAINTRPPLNLFRRHCICTHNLTSFYTFPQWAGDTQPLAINVAKLSVFQPTNYSSTATATSLSTSASILQCNCHFHFSIRLSPCPLSAFSLDGCTDDVLSAVHSRERWQGRYCR